MDTNLAGLAPMLTSTTTGPQWLRNEDRYYAHASLDLPGLARVLHLLGRVISNVFDAPIVARRPAAV
jgi:hypothetical protein